MKDEKKNINDGDDKNFGQKPKHENRENEENTKHCHENCDSHCVDEQADGEQRDTKNDACNCDESCDCGCKDGDECTCEDECCKDGQCKDSKLAAEYLEMAQRLQADFDNYRRRVEGQLDFQREEGKRSVIEVFLPCLDTFKEAKKSITDEKVLSGVEMIEEKILNALKSLNVEKIQTIGNKFDHNLHEVVAIFKNDKVDDDIILDEFQAGWMMNGKVIRYAKVVVNKR